jgi:hypothetical protein
VACVAQNNSARPADSCFDSSGVGVNVRNIGVTRDDQSGSGDFVQAWQSRHLCEFKVRMRHILRICRKQVSHALFSGIVAWRDQIFVFYGCRDCALHVRFFERLA